MKVAVLVGGPSGEAEVSRRSGRRVLEALRRLGHDAQLVELERDFLEKLKGFDVVFVMLHGTPGEDGTVQGALELAGFRFTGSDHFASAFAMDKLMAKRAFAAEGLPTPPYEYPRPGEGPEEVARRALGRFGLPLVLKPRREGSSLGVSIAHDEAELFEGARALAQRYGELWFVEKFIEGKTVTCGVLGTGAKARPVPVLELRVKGREFYDYTAKYTKGLTEFVIPAELPEPVYRRVQKLAVEAHNLLGCRGFSRVDFVATDEEAYILEVNSLPGMTELSDLPAEAEAAGISYEKLVELILQEATDYPDLKLR